MTSADIPPSLGEGIFQYIDPCENLSLHSSATKINLRSSAQYAHLCLKDGYQSDKCGLLGMEEDLKDDSNKQQCRQAGRITDKGIRRSQILFLCPGVAYHCRSKECCGSGTIFS
jgi:hypothetical protein